MVSDRPASVAVAPLMRQELPPTPEELFAANLRVIEAVIRLVARRYRLTRDERDEFAGEVRLKLIEHDYGILRRFRYQSSLKTFLVTVIQRLFLDFRDKKWGKWRPSAEAQRLGPVATRLERLVYRDGLTFDEAVGVVTTGKGVTLSRDELYTLFQALPPRKPRRFVGEEVLDQEPVPGVTSEETLLAQEAAEPMRRARQALADALRTLPAQDQLIVKLHFVDGMTVADIARLMHLEQKPLYRRLARIRATLRTMLEAQGIKPEDFLGGGEDEEQE